MFDFSIGRLVGRVALAVALLGPAQGAEAQDAVPDVPPPTWTGTAGLGVSLTGGNSDTASLNLAFDLTRDPKTRHVFKATGLYLRGSQNDAVTVNRTSLGARHEYTVSARTFLFGQVSYLRDTFKRIDYLVAPTGGIGYKVVDTDITKFAVDAGFGAVMEKNPGTDLSTSVAVTAGEQLTHQLTATASIRQAVTALWKADDFADGLYTFSIGLTTQVSEKVQLSIDLLDTLKNRPPTSDTKKNDIALVTAITAKF